MGAEDKDIISIKPSLVWKIYAKGGGKKDAESTAAPGQPNLNNSALKNLASTPESKPKENAGNGNGRVLTKPPISQTMLECPLKKELNCTFKPGNNQHSFRMHFFQHYPVEEYWEERVSLSIKYYTFTNYSLRIES